MDADQLLRQADQAMYQAKLSGKNRFHLFDAEQDSSIRGHHESLENIRLGLERNEFVLHYQPKVNMRSGCVVGAEALIRWQHPQRGLLAPAAFLPATEDDPIAVAIGECANRVWICRSA
jgi:predicted signal transduction protein with EAL and GGDEF domain